MIDLTKFQVCSGSMSCENKPISKVYQEYEFVDVMKTTSFNPSEDLSVLQDDVIVSTSVAKSFCNCVLGVLGPTSTNLSQHIKFYDAVTHTTRIDWLKCYYRQWILTYHKMGVDGLLVETVVDCYNLELVLNVIASLNLGLKFIVTVAPFGDKMFCGHDYKYAFSMAKSFGVSALGFNCIPSQNCLDLLKDCKETNIPLVCNPGGSVDFDSYIKDIKPYVTLYGGCCGTTPENIRKIKCLQ